jgi:hypothetical protein
MNEIAELLERFRRGPELIASALTGAAGSEVDYKPAPGKWSVREIAAHLSDAELVGAERFRRVIAEENAPLTAYDQNKWAENLDYARRKPSQSLEMFRSLRAESHDLLKGLPESAFQRTGQHSERGTMTLLALVELYARHAEKHAQQIRDVRAAFKQAKAASHA